MRRWIIPALLLVALAVAAGIALSRLSPLLNWARATVLAEVTTRLGREVAVGDVELRPWGAVVLRDVAVARWERLAEGRGFEARAVTVALRLLPLLRGRLEIGPIQLAAPRLWMEVDEEGRSNWDSLLRRPRRDGVAWSAIRITDGAISYHDRRRALTVTGQGVNGRIAPGPDGKFRSGRGELAATRLTVARGGWTFPELALRVAGGWVGPALELSELVATTGGSRLVAKGRIADLRRLEGSLEGTATLALREVVPHLRVGQGWDGSLTVTGTLAGSPKSPVLEATAEVQELSGPRGVRVHRARGRLSLRPPVLALADWTGEAYGGRFEGEATATLGRPFRYQGRLEASRLDLAALPPPVPRLQGRASGELTFRGEGREIAAEAAVELAEAAPAAPEGWERLPAFIVAPLQTQGPWRATGRLVLAEGRVTIESARLAGGPHRVSGSGSVADGRLDLAVEVKTEKVAALLPARFPAVEGAVRLAGRLEGPFRALRVSAMVEGDRLRWEEFSAERLRAELDWRGRILTVASLSLAGDGGRLTARGIAEFTEGPTPRLAAITADGELQGVSLAPFLARARLRVPASGRVSGRWQWRERGAARSGGAVLALESGNLAGEPISAGRATFAVDGATLRVSALQLEGPAGDLRGELAIEPRRSLKGHFVATVRSLGALRSLDRLAPPLAGQGAITLALGGTPQSPRATAQGGFRDLRLGDLLVGELVGRAAWDGSSATLSARLPALAVTLEGAGGMGQGAPYRLVATLSGTPLAPLTQLRPHLAQRLGEVSGSAVGEVVIEGLWGARPRVRGELRGLTLQALGEEWRSAGVSRWGYAVGRLTVDRVRLESRVGRIEARGSLAPGEAWDLRLEGQVPLTLLERAWGGALIPAARGVAQGKLALSGAWRHPRLRGGLTVERARIEVSGVDGTVTVRRGEIHLDGERLVLDALEAEVGGGTLAASGEATLAGWRPDRFALTLALRDLTLRPARLAAAATRLGVRASAVAPLSGYPAWEEVRARLGGEVRLEGRWGEPEALTASGRLDRLELLSPPLRLVNLEPVRFRYARGGLGVERLRLAGEGTRFLISGRIVPGGEFDLGLDGLLPLRLLATRFPRLFREAEGAARLEVGLAGTWAHPRLKGWAAVENGTLHIRRVPQPFVVERARLAFEGTREGTRARIERLEGRWGEGTYRLEGAATLGSGLAVERLDVTLNGEALRFRVPDVGHGVVDTALRLSGELEALTLAGRITLRRAVYSRDLVPTREPGRAPRRLDEALAELPPALKALRLDLDVEAPGGVWVRNNLARLELRGDLSFRGTLGHPLILGRVEALQGTVVYRRREFRIVSATADLLDPRRLNPQLTVAAETRVQDVTVQLYLTGTLERFTIQLASDPPLRREQIQALVAGGAASFLAGGAYGRLLDEANRVVKLDVFQIDPTTGGAQVRVGKRLSERLELSFSRTVGATPAQRLAVEYHLTDWISLIGSQEERGAYGFDVKFSLSFR